MTRPLRCLRRLLKTRRVFGLLGRHWVGHPHDSPNKSMEEDDYELARSLQVGMLLKGSCPQISEYVNAMRESQLQREKRPVESRSITQFFPKRNKTAEWVDDDIQIEQIDMKGMEKSAQTKKKRSKKELKEEQQSLAINVRFINVLTRVAILSPQRLGRRVGIDGPYAQYSGSI